MNIGVDGSLCRITSSMKDCIPIVRIIKTPDDQLKESEPHYKLVVVANSDEDESASEKSDEEIFDEEIIHIISNVDRKKERCDDKTYEECGVNEPENKTLQEERNTGSNFYYRNNKKFFGRKNSTRALRNFHMNSNRERGYKKFNSANRNSTANSSYAHNISPWIEEPSISHPYANYTYQDTMQEPVRQVPVGSCAESLAIRKGLLGDKPIPPSISTYQMNNHYIPNQASPFAQPPLNYPMNDSNYWDNSYDSNYSNYQMPDASMPAHSSHSEYFQHKRNWKDTKRPMHGSWKRSRQNHVRRNPGYEN